MLCVDRDECLFRFRSVVLLFMFFFKQKTAYDMRISDCGSDVCSSDLAERQMLAFDPLDHGPIFGRPEGHATIGGIVAAGVAGSQRLSCGAARDQTGRA